MEKIEENNKAETKEGMEKSQEIYLKKERETQEAFREIKKHPKDSEEYEKAKEKWLQLKKEFQDVWEKTEYEKESEEKPPEPVEKEKDEEEKEHDRLKNIPSAKSFWTVDPEKMTVDQISRHLTRAKMSGSPVSVGYWKKQLEIAKQKETKEANTKAGAEIDKLNAELKQKQWASANAIEQTKVEEEYREKIKKIRREQKGGFFSVFKRMFSNLFKK